jgi:hypothetical protein
MQGDVNFHRSRAMVTNEILCTDARGLIEFGQSSIAPINGSKGSGACKLSACSRQPVQPHLLASLYWMPAPPGGKYKPSQSCNQTLRKSQLRGLSQNLILNPQLQLTTSTKNFIQELQRGSFNIQEASKSCIMSQSIGFAILALAALGSAGPSVSSPPAYSSSACSSTMCAEYINSCNQTYGGCYPACDGFTTPSFIDPGCPSTTKSPSNTTPPPRYSSCSLTLCVDNVNTCGQMYGGCFPACGNYTTPSFTDPGCPSTIKTSATSCTSSIVESHSTPTTTSCTVGMVTSPSKPSTTASPPSSSTCTQTVCADYVNSCGMMYGGCFPYCEGSTFPSFSAPACPTSYSPGTSTRY